MIKIEFTSWACRKIRSAIGSFSAAITNCLARTHTDHKAALDSLLTLRFQTLEEPQNVAA